VEEHGQVEERGSVISRVKAAQDVDGHGGSEANRVHDRFRRRLRIIPDDE